MKRNELRFGKNYLGEYKVSLWVVKQKPYKDLLISGGSGKTKFKAFVNLIRWIKKYNNLKELFYVRSIEMEYMNTSFERSENTTDEWYTPIEIIQSFGEFDLDPCAPMKPLWKTAKKMFNKEDDGLKQDWEGRVWLNPPYSRPLIELFCKKMAEHGNGIALLFNRLDSCMMKDVVLKNAHAMKFLRKRIRFYRPDGTQGGSPGCGSVLFAFGEENARILKENKLEGVFLEIKR